MTLVRGTPESLVLRREYPTVVGELVRHPVTFGPKKWMNTFVVVQCQGVGTTHITCKDIQPVPDDTERTVL